MEKIFVVLYLLIQTLQVFVHIGGKKAPAVSILQFMRQNKHCHFMGRPGYGLEFR